MRNLLSMKHISDFVVDAVDGARDVDAPFHHIAFDRFFPPDLYQAMIASLPDAADYRPMSGRARENDLVDGTPTRVKIDLFPEYTRFLPPQKREVWDLVGGVLCSSELEAAFVRRLAPGLAQRFGADYDKVGLFPIPVLTRDIAGYHIAPHTDTHWKGVTVLIYLPRDASTAHIGTVLHARTADGTLARAGKGQFLPNTGFAFAVGDESWHSVDTVGPEVTTRDLIILQYFVDSGLQRILRNRGKRVGNFVLNSVRQFTRSFQ